MDFSNMEVTIDHIADAGAKIKAYATVTFDGMFKVHGVRLAESKQGLNIFMPQKAFNKNGKTLFIFRDSFGSSLTPAGPSAVGTGGISSLFIPPKQPVFATPVGAFPPTKSISSSRVN